MNGQFSDSLGYFASSIRDAGKGFRSMLIGTEQLASKAGISTARGAKNIAKKTRSAIMNAPSTIAHGIWNTGSKTVDGIGIGIERMGYVTSMVADALQKSGKRIQQNKVVRTQKIES